MLVSPKHHLILIRIGFQILVLFSLPYNCGVVGLRELKYQQLIQISSNNSQKNKEC